MSSAAISNPLTQTESKTGKKKKSKAEVPANASNAPSTTPSAEVGVAATATEGTTNGVEGSYESPYMKELYKLVSTHTSLCRVVDVLLRVRSGS